MDQRSLLLIFSLAFTGLTSGAGVLPDGPLNAAVGGTVMFTVSPVEGTIFIVDWLFKGERIFFSSPDGNITSPGYEGRVSFFPSTGSLELRTVSLNDSGEYSVIIPTVAGQNTGSVTLDVYEPIFKVNMSHSGTDLLESDSVRFSCSVSTGSSLVFLWMNSSSEVTASDRVQITGTAGGSNLTITNVTRYDEGTYKCTVSNPVSSETSPEVNLTVSYGPENTVLQISPSQEYYEIGAEITMSCSADSRPEAEFKWFVNETERPHTGSELRLTDLQFDDSGNYSCMASNSRTSKNETSAPVSMSVTERVSNPLVTSSTDRPIEGNSVNLTCDATGSVFTRRWMKDGSNLILSDNTLLYDNNRVLSFQPLERTSKGEYSCEISNPINSVTSEYDLVVNYGPENVQITGETQISLGGTITLTCTADSEPSASYTWSLNVTEIPEASTEQYTKQNAQLSDTGRYTCQAKNSITGMSASAVLDVTVSGKKSPSCSAGCIAGIVIACLVVCGGAAAGGYFVYKKKKSRSSSNKREGGEGRNNTTFSEDGEVKYADVAAFRKRDGGVVRLGSQNETTDYAQVRGSNNPPKTSSPPTYDDHMQRGSSQASQPSANGSNYAQIRKK